MNIFCDSSNFYLTHYIFSNLCTFFLNMISSDKVLVYFDGFKLQEEYGPSQYTSMSNYQSLYFPQTILDSSMTEQASTPYARFEIYRIDDSRPYYDTIDRIPCQVYCPWLIMTRVTMLLDTCPLSYINYHPGFSSIYDQLIFKLLMNHNSADKCCGPTNGTGNNFHQPPSPNLAHHTIVNPKLLSFAIADIICETVVTTTNVNNIIPSQGPSSILNQQCSNYLDIDERANFDILSSGFGNGHSIIINQVTLEKWKYTCQTLNHTVVDYIHQMFNTTIGVSSTKKSTEHYYIGQIFWSFACHFMSTNQFIFIMFDYRGKWLVCLFGKKATEDGIEHKCWVLDSFFDFTSLLYTLVSNSGYAHDQVKIYKLNEPHIF